MKGKRIQRMMDRIEGVGFCTLNTYLSAEPSTHISKNLCRGICCVFCQKECMSRCYVQRDQIKGCIHARGTFKKAFLVYKDGK